MSWRSATPGRPALSSFPRPRARRWPTIPGNLLLVQAEANRQKGDGDAATWLPSNKRFRCPYVARQVAVKRKYHLWVTRAERDAITRVLDTCPEQKLPKGKARVVVSTTSTQRTPATTSARKTANPTRTRPSGTGHVYANCTAARGAGASPVRRGTPDYNANPQLDRDGDGIACES